MLGFSYIFSLFLSVAAAQEIKVLSDGAPPQPPGIVHFVAKDKSELAVSLITATDKNHAGNVTVIEKLYTNLCTMPCAVEMPVGWHEMRFAYKDVEWTRKIEIRPGEQTYTVMRFRPTRKFYGLAASYTVVLLPVGIPLLVTSGGGKPKWSEGPPPQVE